jgi:hypothetical protein
MALILKAIRQIDPADALVFGGLLSLTAGALLAHPALALLVFGLGSMYLGLAAGKTPRSK